LVPKDEGGSVRTVELDDDVWSALKRIAVPFDDTPSSVLRRLLGLDEPRARSASIRLEQESRDAAGQSSSADRKVAAGKTPSHVYRKAIVEVLISLGGHASAGDATREVEKRLRVAFTASDLAMTASGGPHWKAATQCARSQLVQQGILESDSPIGTWELSLHGRKAAASDSVG
jgi:negative regulator of replication initiation